MKKLLLTGAAIALSALSTASAAAAQVSAQDTSTCRNETVYFYSYRGEQLCNTLNTGHVFFHDDGTDSIATSVERMWIIGTNGEIYNIVFDHRTGVGSSWKSLGGQGRQYVGVHSSVNSHNLTIDTIGTNGLRYCDDLTSIGWGGWYRCG